MQRGDYSTSVKYNTVETAFEEKLLVLRAYFKDDGTFPNNPSHPLLIYKNVWDGSTNGVDLFIRNGWTQPWAWGIFEFHHYHSTAWEALLCIKGEACIQFGGPLGPKLQASKGDLILIPPGVAHRQITARGGFTLLGSYPNETPHADTVKGKPTPHERANIASCPVPTSDPIFGASAPWGSLRMLL